MCDHCAPRHFQAPANESAEQTLNEHQEAVRLALATEPLTGVHLHSLDSAITELRSKGEEAAVAHIDTELRRRQDAQEPIIPLADPA
jgi:hypothetical protein